MAVDPPSEEDQELKTDKATPKGPSAYRKQNASVTSEVKVRPAA